MMSNEVFGRKNLHFLASTSSSLNRKSHYNPAIDTSDSFYVILKYDIKNTIKENTEENKHSIYSGNIASGSYVSSF